MHALRLIFRAGIM